MLESCTNCHYRFRSTSDGNEIPIQTMNGLQSNFFFRCTSFRTHIKYVFRHSFGCLSNVYEQFKMSPVDTIHIFFFFLIIVIQALREQFHKINFIKWPLIRIGPPRMGVLTNIIINSIEVNEYYVSCCTFARMVPMWSAVRFVWLHFPWFANHQFRWKKSTVA